MHLHHIENRHQATAHHPAAPFPATLPLRADQTKYIEAVLHKPVAAHLQAVRVAHHISMAHLRAIIEAVHLPAAAEASAEAAVAAVWEEAAEVQAPIEDKYNV